jgi:predicted Zn-ribbon and HTH transcriptional regulator
MKIKPSIFTFLFLTAIIFSCGSEEKNENTSDSSEVIKNESENLNESNINHLSKDTLNKVKKNIVKNNTKYICPQGDKEGNLDKPGICPVCGMELIENPDYTSIKTE